MAVIYVMMGLPGSGKSTFAKDLLNVYPVLKEHSVIVSRDEIRFSIVREDEAYFSHEKEVTKQLWDTINKYLAEDKNVFIDQTSLTPRSRRWLLQHIHGYDKAILIWIDENLETCINRNKNRKGTRTYVPEDSIRNMAFSLKPPSLAEGFDIIMHYDGEKQKLTIITERR